MPQAKVLVICIGPVAKGPMKRVDEVEAIAGAGLEGDRYCTGEGSYNKGRKGKRQVTLLNASFLIQSAFTFEETRRNILTADVELMSLIGEEFYVGDVHMRGIKYCIPCDIPSQVSGRAGFKEAFQDRAGIVAEIIEGGLIKIGDRIIPPPRAF